MRKRLPLRQWKENFLNGEYDSKCLDIQCKAGWYDWFCRDSSLQCKTDRFGKIIARINNDFLLDNYYVWFKNNCPTVGPLYDDMRFEPLNEEVRDKLYFVISCGDIREKNKYVVYTARSGYNNERGFDTIAEVVNFLNSWAA